MGYLAQYRGNDEETIRCFTESLMLFQEMDIKDGIGGCLVGWAGVMVKEGQAEQAARLIGAVETLRETNGLHTTPVARAEYEHNEAAIRTQLGEAAFEAARSAGRVMPIEAAIDIALSRRSRRVGLEPDYAK